ncbi:hypothetical protein JW823_06390 [bacterium]|nr:hypothetical protein [candidate division CSSED10-310 bacterium]
MQTDEGAIDAMMDYVNQYVDMLEKKKRSFLVLDEQIFARRGRWIVPVGPISQRFRLTRADCRWLLKKLGGLWVQWTDGFDASPHDSRWHAIVCDHYTEVDDVDSANARKNIRKGLRHCEVRRIEACDIANEGYDVFIAAIQTYERYPELPSRDEFEQRVMTDEPFPELRHQWGVFHDGKMIAFAQNLVYDRTEVNYALGKLHPEYLKCYPGYALFQTMNEFYLKDNGFQYINAGFKAISHETDIQDFLIRLFGFYRKPMGLHIHYRWPIGLIMELSKPFRGGITRLLPISHSMFELDSARIRD